MSASNLIVGPSAAYLLADRAMIRSDGKLVASLCKISTSQRFKIALCITGSAATDTNDLIIRWLAERRGQDEVLQQLPALVALQREEVTKLVLASNSRENMMRDECKIRLTVAIWHDGRKQPEGYIVCEGDSTINVKVPAMQVMGARRSIAPAVPEAAMPDCMTFEPDRDALALLDAQRGAKTAAGHLMVDDGIDVATVTAQGVSVKALRASTSRAGRLIGQRRPILSLVGWRGLRAA